MRADGVDASRGRGAARARAAGPSGSAPSRARSGFSTRWRRARASSRSTTRGAAAARARHRGRLLPAVRLSRARRSTDIELTLDDGARRARRTTSASRCRIRCPARRSTSACRRSSGRSRTGSTPNDLAMMYRGDLRAGLLSRAARARPRASSGCARRGGAARGRRVGTAARDAPPSRCLCSAMQAAAAAAPLRRGSPALRGATGAAARRCSIPLLDAAGSGRCRA